MKKHLMILKKNKLRDIRTEKLFQIMYIIMPNNLIYVHTQKAIKNLFNMLENMNKKEIKIEKKIKRKFINLSKNKDFQTENILGF